MKAVIDRINENKITLELEDKSIAFMDLKIIPNAKEGDVLKIELCENDTEMQKKNIDNLMNKLFED